MVKKKKKRKKEEEKRIDMVFSKFISTFRSLFKTNLKFN